MTQQLLLSCCDQTKTCNQNYLVSQIWFRPAFVRLPAVFIWLCSWKHWTHQQSAWLYHLSTWKFKHVKFLCEVVPKMPLFVTCSPSLLAWANALPSSHCFKLKCTLGMGRWDRDCLEAQATHQDCPGQGFQQGKSWSCPCLHLVPHWHLHAELSVLAELKGQPPPCEPCLWWWECQEECSLPLLLCWPREYSYKLQ